MNAENPVQIDLFGVFATGTNDTRLAEHIGGDARTHRRDVGHSLCSPSAAPQARRRQRCPRQDTWRGILGSSRAPLRAGPRCTSSRQKRTFTPSTGDA
jgi:hypothetical protein